MNKQDLEHWAPQLLVVGRIIGFQKEYLGYGDISLNQQALSPEAPTIAVGSREPGHL